MGYTSDVFLAAVFETKEIRDEVWAVYCMAPIVQEADVAKDWKTYDGDAYVLWFEASGVKWYDSYTDVRAFELMHEFAEQFADNRGIHFAWQKLRIGEELNDIEDDYHVRDREGGKLQEFLWDQIRVVRYVEHHFH